MKRQVLINKLSPECRERLDKSINDILRISSITFIRPLIRHVQTIRNFIIRSIAEGVYRKKSINVSDDISDNISDKIFRFLETENYLIDTNREKLDVIEMLKLKNSMNDIHREFKRILQENEA